MKKAGVGRDLFNALEYALDKEKGWSKYELLSEHSRKKGDWHSKKLLPLKKLSVLELADILINGYELKINQEEEEFKKQYNIQKTLSQEIDYEKYKELHLNVMLGMRMAYKIFTGKEMEDE